MAGCWAWECWDHVCRNREMCLTELLENKEGRLGFCDKLDLVVLLSAPKELCVRGWDMIQYYFHLPPFTTPYLLVWKLFCVRHKWEHSSGNVWLSTSPSLSHWLTWCVWLVVYLGKEEWSVSLSADFSWCIGSGCISVLVALVIIVCANVVRTLCYTCSEIKLICKWLLVAGMGWCYPWKASWHWCPCALPCVSSGFVCVGVSGCK